MKRPETHVTGDKGVLRVQQLVNDGGWVARAQVPDYGSDVEVEVFGPGGDSTGMLAKAQIKSTDAPTYSADGSFISFSLEIDRARYLAQELTVPAFLMIADTKSGEVYFTAPQIDQSLLARLRADDPPKEVTIRVSTSNALSAGLAPLKGAIRRVGDVLAIRGFASIPSIELHARAVEVGAPPEETIEEVRERLAYLEIGHARATSLAGEWDKAIDAIRKVAADDRLPVEARFQALLQEAKSREVRALHSEQGDEGRHRVALEVGAALRSLTRKGPPGLKAYALVYNTAAKFSMVVFRYWSLMMTITAGGLRPANRELEASLRRRRILMRRDVDRRFRACLRLIDRMGGSRYRVPTAHAMVEVAEALQVLRYRTQLDGERAAFEVVRGSAFAICRFAFDIGAINTDEVTMMRAVVAAGQLADSETDEEAIWSTSAVERIPQPDRAVALELLQAARDRRRGTYQGYVKPVTNQQILENSAAALDIDLRKSEDPVAVFIREAIRDVDPTRVMLDCQSLFVEWADGEHPVALEMNLPTEKRLSCTRHGHALEGQNLDAIARDFKARFCADCPDREPRDPDWKFPNA